MTQHLKQLFQGWDKLDCDQQPYIECRSVHVERAFCGGYHAARKEADGIVLWLDEMLNHGPLSSEDYRLAQKALKMYREEPTNQTHN